MAETQPPLLSMAEQFTGLPMQDLIGAPLQAAANANAMMAMTQVKSLLDTAFSEKPSTNDSERTTYSPILITMTVTRGVVVPTEITDIDNDDTIVASTIEQVMSTIDVPLLTLLPLNSLGVDDVQIDFAMEVMSSFSESTNEATQEMMAAAAEWSAKLKFGLFSTTVTGKVNYNSESSSKHDTSYEKNNSAQYKIGVHAGQLPMPDGVKIIIEALTNAISPIEMPALVT